MLKIGNRLVTHEGEGFVGEDHEVSVDVVETEDGYLVELLVQHTENETAIRTRLPSDSARYLGIILIEAALLSDLQFSPSKELEGVHNEH